MFSIVIDSNVDRLPQLLVIFVEQTQKSESFGDAVPRSDERYEQRQISTFDVEVEIEKRFGCFDHRKTSSEIGPEIK